MATGDTPAGQGGKDLKAQHQHYNFSQNNKPRQKDVNSSSNVMAQVSKEKFIGQLDDLKSFIYNVTNLKGGVTYTLTTEEIARHVSKNIPQPDPPS